MSSRPRCNKSDCFQNKCGTFCDLLTARIDDPCPFYKTNQEAEDGRILAHRKLVADGRLDLIEKYEYTPYRRGQW